MFNMTEIGRKIAKRRKELNMTQVELADRLLVSYQAVSQWELGKSMPELSNLTNLAQILDMPLDELLGQKESKVVQQVVEQTPLSDDDLVEAAPFIKPSAIDEQMTDRPFKSATLISLAPFLDSESLMKHIRSGQIKGLSNQFALMALAPFLDKTDLSNMVPTSSADEPDDDVDFVPEEQEIQDDVEVEPEEKPAPNDVRNENQTDKSTEETLESLLTQLKRFLKSGE